MLVVCQDCGDIPDLVSLVQSTLLAAWKIQRFTESRWHTIGESSRGLMVAHLSGLPGLIDFIYASTTSSTYLLGGWRRLQGDRLTFVATLSVVSRISDALLTAVMEDGRVVRTIEDLKGIAEEEIAWVVQLPQAVYEKLASVCDLCPDELRDVCLSAAHVNIAFVQQRVFDRVDEHRCGRTWTVWHRVISRTSKWLRSFGNCFAWGTRTLGW